MKTAIIILVLLVSFTACKEQKKDNKELQNENITYLSIFYLSQFQEIVKRKF